MRAEFLCKHCKRLSLKKDIEEHYKFHCVGLDKLKIRFNALDSIDRTGTNVVCS